MLCGGGVCVCVCVCVWGGGDGEWNSASDISYKLSGRQCIQIFLEKKKFRMLTAKIF